MPDRPRGLAAWFTETTNLRTFAAVNIWFWLTQHAVVTFWYVARNDDWGIGIGGFYLVHISIAALWLSSLAWWQSTRVEERQIDAEPNQPPTFSTSSSTQWSSPPAIASLEPVKPARKRAPAKKAAKSRKKAK